MESIHPLTGTYFTLLPIELRELLYLYFNTEAMTYKNGENKRSVVTDIRINGLKITLHTNKVYMKLLGERLLSFIDDLKQHMSLNTKVGRQIALNELLLLTLDTEYFIVIENTTNEAQVFVSSATYVPVCIQFVECLQQVYEILNKYMIID